MDRKEIEHIQSAQRAYHEASQPFIKTIAGIHGRPRLIMQGGKVASYETVYTPEQEYVITECRSAIRNIRERIMREFGLSAPPTKEEA